MLHTKDIKNLSELSATFCDTHKKSKFFTNYVSILNLGKSQSTDFDVQVADTTTVMVQYIFLSIKKRIESYQTLGKLFENTKAECLEIKLHQRLIALLIAILKIVEELFPEVDSQKMMARMLNDSNYFERIKRIFEPDANLETNRKVA